MPKVDPGGGHVNARQGQQGETGVISHQQVLKNTQSNKLKTSVGTDWTAPNGEQRETFPQSVAEAHLIFSFEQKIRRAYLVDVEVLSEKRSLLLGRLPAVVGQNLPQGLHGAVWLAQREELTADGEVDVVLGQRPAPLLVHLHGLTVAAQGVLPLVDADTR